jgi:hypothetical protein
MMLDPGESMNLSDQFPDVTQELAQKWHRYAEDVGVVPSQATNWPDN